MDIHYSKDLATWIWGHFLGPVGIAGVSEKDSSTIPYWEEALRDRARTSCQCVFCRQLSATAFGECLPLGSASFHFKGHGSAQQRNVNHVEKVNQRISQRFPFAREIFYSTVHEVSYQPFSIYCPTSSPFFPDLGHFWCLVRSRNENNRIFPLRDVLNLDKAIVWVIHTCAKLLCCSWIFPLGLNSWGTSYRFAEKLLFRTTRFVIAWWEGCTTWNSDPSTLRFCWSVPSWEFSEWSNREE